MSVALTAFSGIAVVVGRRSVGRSTRSDVVRFTTRLVNGVMAVLFCLMSILFFDEGAKSCFFFIFQQVETQLCASFAEHSRNSSRVETFCEDMLTTSERDTIFR